MSNPYIWAGLQRATNDPTTIDEAIGEAVVAHNDDPNAHLEAGQALESHRAAEIIDHRAESIVNDKIRNIARAYIAIVDPSSETDFDTIGAAIEYAEGAGGGTIYIAPGDHYISGVVEMSFRINLQGADFNSTRISANYSGGDYIKVVQDAVTNQNYCTVTNLNFVTTGGGTILVEAEYSGLERTIIFDQCAFTGTGRNVVASGDKSIFIDCAFDANDTGVIGATRNIIMERCVATGRSGSYARTVVSPSDYDTNDCEIIIDTCNFIAPSAATSKWFGDNYYNTLRILNSRMNGCNFLGMTYGELVMIGNYIDFYSSGYLIIDAYYSIVNSNVFGGGTGNKVRLTSSSSRCIVANNMVRTAITNSGTNNIVANNVVS